MNNWDALALAPDRVSVTDEDGRTYLLTATAEGAYGGPDDLSVFALPKADDGGLAIGLSAPKTAVRRVHLRWRVPLAEGVRLLGDHWERGYGDLEWRGIVPERRMPWYFLATRGDETNGVGVETGAGAVCWWQADTDGVSLTLDVSNGAKGVLLGDRALHAATVHVWTARPGESAMEAARGLCRKLSPAPRLPASPVYGSNDWYWAYGRNSAETVLRDAESVASLAPAGENRPWVVIDDGWQVTEGPARGAPWVGGRHFPDVPGLAERLRGMGVRPGIWMRPLLSHEKLPGVPHLPVRRATGAYNDRILDPSAPEALAVIADDVRLLTDGYGFELVKHDFSTYDLFGQWGFEMDDLLTAGDWHFADRSRTTAEIIRSLYQTIRDAAGKALIIGCNTVGHLGAGLFEIQRTGDDTSGREWERTRKMGINTLAFRMPQHGTFFAADADCVGLTPQVPWRLNRQWLDLLARSGTPLFVSPHPDALNDDTRAALREAFALAAAPQEPAEPLDWLATTCPRRWRFGDGEEVTYHWHHDEGG
jgi:alpha-galactosidase